MATALPAHKTILLVEDDADVRDSIAEILAAAGRKVVTARDGAEALALLETVEKPCIILLDLMMPVMNGFEFLDRLRSRRDAHEFPVLVVSANRDVKKAEIYPGVLGTLKKPFDIEDLLTAVDAHC